MAQITWKQNTQNTQNTQNAQDKKIGVAVIGAGGWGRNHVRNFAKLPQASLLWVCDRDAKAQALALTMVAPQTQVSAHVSHAFADPSVHAVVIATDAPSHASLIRQALDAGKDVFAEKPLTLDADTAKALCADANARGRILMTGHLMLYHPAVDALRDLIASGELGDVLYLHSQRVNLGVVRQAENAWWSLAPHDISVANDLLGAVPEMVSATGSVFLQKERGVEDVVFATLHYPEGRMAHIHVSWLDPHKRRQLTVVGSRKMAVFNDTSPDQKLCVFDKGVEPPSALTYADGVRVRTGDIRIPALPMREPLRRECEAFLDAVSTRKPPRADGFSGYEVVRVLAAGSESLKRGGEPVPL